MALNLSILSCIQMGISYMEIFLYICVRMYTNVHVLYTQELKVWGPTGEDLENFLVGFLEEK